MGEINTQKNDAISSLVVSAWSYLFIWFDFMLETSYASKLLTHLTKNNHVPFNARFFLHIRTTCTRRVLVQSKNKRSSALLAPIGTSIAGNRRRRGSVWDFPNEVRGL